MHQTSLEMVFVDSKSNLIVMEALIKLIKKELNNVTWSSNELEYLFKLKHVELKYKEISELPFDVFKNLINLESIDLSNNLINALPKELFKNLNLLKHVDFSHNQIDNIPDDLFYDKFNLEWVNFSYNQIYTISSNLFNHNKNIIKILFINNQIEEIPNDLFKELYKLEWIDFSGNQLVTLSNDFLNHLPSLRGINFSFNQITYLPNDLFKDKCLFNLRAIYFNNNLLNGMPGDFFDGLLNLSAVNFSHNHIYYLGKDLFRNLSSLELLDFSHNELSYLSNSLFKDLIHLETVNFSYNYLDTLPNNLIKNNRNLVSVKFSNNKIDSINYSLLKLYHYETLKIDLRDNFDIFDLDLIYNKFFYLNKTQTLDLNEKREISNLQVDKNDNISVNSDILTFIKYLENEKYYLLRHKDTRVLNQRLFMFYLSKSFSNLNSIFDDYFKVPADLSNCLGNKSFEYRIKKLNDYKWSLLDFLVHFEDFNNEILLNLIKYIDSNLNQNKSIINVEFKLRSIESVTALCQRNSPILFDKLFDFESIQKCIRDYNHNNHKLNEYIWLNKDENLNLQSFFLKIDYCECFEIIIKNKNEQMAVYLISLIKLAILFDLNHKNSDFSFEEIKNDPKYNNILVRFNNELLNKYLKQAFDLNWQIFLNFCLDYAKDGYFLSLTQTNLVRFNTNLTLRKAIQSCIFNNRIYPENSLSTDVNEEADILRLISKSSDYDKILSHETLIKFVESKWKYTPKFHYYLNLLIYLTFLIFYSINVELFKDNKLNMRPLETLSFSISIFLTFLFIIIHYVNIFDLYLSDEMVKISKLTIIELINNVLCVIALFINNKSNYLYNIKSSLYSITILTSYFLFFSHLNKVSLLGLDKIINLFFFLIDKYLKLLFLSFILFLGLVFSFRNRSKYVDRPSFLNQTSFELSMFKILNLVSQYNSYQLGLADSIDRFNLINYLLYAFYLIFIYGMFLFIICYAINQTKIFEKLKVDCIIKIKIKDSHYYENYISKCNETRDKSIFKKMFYIVIAYYIVSVDYLIKYLIYRLKKSKTCYLKTKNNINVVGKRHVLSEPSHIFIADQLSQLTLILNKLKKIDSIDNRLKIFEKYKLKRREKKFIRLDKICKKLEDIDKKMTKTNL